MLVQIEDKIFIDSKYTYYVGYYFDRSKRLISISEVVDFKLINYWEFPDLATAREYMTLCWDMIDDEEGRLLFQIHEKPIEQSLKYTNKLPIEIIYN
jgi:hypothetical protein